MSQSNRDKAIAAVNLVILTGLLAIWTDKVELTFNDFVRPVEFLKILGFTVLSLLGMWLLINMYAYDGFLPDYLFTLTYDVPKELEVETINYTKGDFTKYQRFEIVGNLKHVTYNEGER